MALDEENIFREGTIQICSHLEVEKVIQSCFLYFRSFIPVRRMYLHLEYPETQSMNFIAKADVYKVVKLDLNMSVPPEHHSQFIEYENHVRSLGDQMFSFEEPDTFAKHIFDFLKEPYSPAMGLGFVVGEQMPIGGVTVFAEDGKCFTKEQTDLLRILKEPFVLTLLNALKHRRTVIRSRALEDDNRFLQSELRRISGDQLIGADFGLRDVMRQVNQVAPTESPVLLTGETGAGKDIIANAIHLASRRSKGPFIPVNCGAIPESLIDSELFGHEKGAFTGALSLKRGRFERAHTGTILLDEIGEMPVEAQIRLLRVLQNREIERIGGNKLIKLDIRIIAATNKNLDQEVREGRFREDLWFRLNVFPIAVPPLRERKKDIPALVDYFIDRKAKELKIGKIPRLAEGAIEVLQTYTWPGNVRELENLLERAMILHQGEPLSFDDIRTSTLGPTSENLAAGNEQSLKLDLVVAAHIRSVLKMTGGKIHGPGGAGEILGVNPNTLRTKMSKLGIQFPKKK
ncbi:sigma-54-dependent Fis family transcriptional regulator [Desulfopila sp. IMCC35008]|uniref:sigma-54 interaction domain-containing protein n=1 Tax=Desulfopila sp. IMCC35008 TaxID=2653858 RepID=UPI0013D01568|nr:sigma-54 dependent transcriptional regulator [Desulfopila sp. IMCC35008]